MTGQKKKKEGKKKPLRRGALPPGALPMIFVRLMGPLFA